MEAACRGGPKVGHAAPEAGDFHTQAPGWEAPDRGGQRPRAGKWLYPKRGRQAAASIADMLARLQRFVTLGLVAFVVAWAGAALAGGRPAWAAGGLLVVVLGYLGFMALEFALASWQHGDDPAPQASVGQLVRAWWGEVTTSPRVFCWDQPFRWHAWPDHLPAGSRQRGLVLVHGFVCNRGLWNSWLPRLTARGVPFVAVNLEPVFSDIGAYAGLVGDAVARVHAATGQAPVVVAHSMGGLAVRAWLARTDGRAVHRVITIATPHHGTWTARFSRSTNALDMQQGSGLLAQLEAREDAARRGRFTCFYSHCDNIVFPPSTATLADADNRHVQGVAHVHLVHQPAVFDEVLHWLAQASGAVDDEVFTPASVEGAAVDGQSH